jgi:hypothetical protein
MKSPKTFEELVKWIEKNAPRSGETAEDAAYWFVAYQQASDLRDANTIKDWAHMLLNGCKPLKGDKLEVTLLLEEAVGDDEAQLATLKDFFGV